MIKKINIVLCIFLTSLIVGCASQAPEPGHYRYSTQKKLQSAKHWDILARDMAGKIVAHIQTTDLIGYPVFIMRKPSNIPFNHAFNELLSTHLFNAGVDITENPYTDGALVLRYNTLLIDHHDPKYIKPPSGVLSFVSQSIWARSQWAANENPWLGGLALLGIGLGEELVGGLYWDDNNLLNSELIINVSLQKDGQYVLRKVAIYYVSDADFSYATSFPYNPAFDKASVKTFRVVGGK